MANTKSAKKAIRVSKRKAVFNLERKKKVSVAVKSVRKLVEAGKISKEDSFKAQSALQKEIDKAVKSNLLNKSKAARIKSRMNAKLKAAVSK